jgi:hypothetical protein
MVIHWVYNFGGYGKKGGTMYRLFLAFLICSIGGVVNPAPTSADCSEGTTYTHFNLALAQGEPLGCQWALGPGPQLVQVTVTLLTAPAGKVRFSLPDPPFGTLVGEGWNFPFTGDRLNGMEMQLGCSGGGLVVLGTLAVLLEPGVTVPCTQWKVADGCEAEDCNGSLRPAMAATFTFITSQDPYGCNTCFQYCQGLPPYDLYPPAGATQVPLDVELSWGAPIFEYPYPDLECGIWIGTDPACSGGQGFLIPCDAPAIVLDFLEPSTTYYWRGIWRVLFGSGCSSGSGDAGVSPVHSFTTAGPTAAEPSTWGRVKAMYRD